MRKLCILNKQINKKTIWKQKIKENALFNPEGDTETRFRKMIGGNTTNLNDFNNMRYHG